MNTMFILGWALAVTLRTLIPFWQEQHKDGRKWDWAYIMPPLMSAFMGAIAQFPAVQESFGVPESGLPAFVAGMTAAVAMHEVGIRTKKFSEGQK